MMSNNSESHQSTEIPEPIRRIESLLTELVEVEIPPLEAPEECSFVYSVFQLDQPFGQAWERLHNTAITEFSRVRSKKTCIDADNQDDFVHFTGIYSDEMNGVAYCSIPIYADGTVSVTSEAKYGSMELPAPFLDSERGEPIIPDSIQTSIYNALEKPS